jgi:hypothetical protein
MAIVNGSLELGYKDLAWFGANPTLILKEGQIVYLGQTGTYKIGDGVTALSVLSFLGISSETQTLQNVTDLGNVTTNNIEANSFIKTGGTSNEFLKANGDIDTNQYVVVEAGKGLSENDFTDADKTKLDGIEEGAEVNVNADWNATSGDAQILNKPTIPSIEGLVPETRTITINGLTKDLSANQEWTLGSTTGVRTPYTFIATAGQTTFTTVGYTVGQIDVYYNGSKQLPSEYTATNGTTVVFPTGKIAGDEIEIVVWTVSDIASTLTLDTSGFGEEKTFNASTNTLTIDKYSWMDLARGYTVEPTLFTATATYEVYEYEYSSSTLYRKIMNDGSLDGFYSESGLINLLCTKKIIL